LVRALTPITLDDLRRMAVAQSLFPPTTLNALSTASASCRLIRFARRLALRT